MLGMYFVKSDAEFIKIFTLLLQIFDQKSFYLKLIPRVFFFEII